MPTQRVVVRIARVGIRAARSRVGVGVLLDAKGEDGEHGVGPIIRPTQHAFARRIVEVPLLLAIDYF